MGIKYNNLTPLVFPLALEKKKENVRRVGWKDPVGSIFLQCSLVWSLNLKEWKWDGCDWLLLWKPTFPLPTRCSFIPNYPSAQPPYVGWQNIDAFIQSLIKTHNWHQHVMDDTSSWGRFRQVHMKKRGEMCLSLTAVGNSKTVRHFQIVNVRRQSEFRGAKLNHSYPKCAVLLIRAPWKKSPWNRHKIPVTLSQFPTARHIFQTICSFAFYAQIRSFLAYSGFFF